MIVVVLGGLGSISGAMIGGIILGLVSSTRHLLPAVLDDDRVLRDLHRAAPVKA